MYSVLQKLLNDAVTPCATLIEDILPGVEKAVLSLPVEMAEEARKRTMRIIKSSSRPRDNIRKTERSAFKRLKDNTNLTVLPADNENATVVFNTSDYKEKITYLLEDPAYRNLVNFPSNGIEWTTKLLLKKSSLTEETRRQLCPSGSRSPRLYGMPKIYKEGIPLRHIVSNIGDPIYQHAKHLTGLLRQL